MDIDRTKLYAVISGDIIASSELPPSERVALLDTMKQVSNELRTFLADSVPLSVDIYAGDSWQLLLTQPGDALRAALYYRASIIAATKKKVDTRIAVAVGTVDFVPGERVSQGDGEAFRLSGRTLHETARKQRLRFAASRIDDGATWDAAFGLIDALVKRWSARQASAVVGALQGWSQAEIAAASDPPLDRSSVARFLGAASWHPIEQVIKVFSEAIPSLR